MNNLPPEIIINIASQCDTKGMAALRCSFQGFNILLNHTLCTRNVELEGSSCVQYAMTQCHSEDVSVAILRNAKSANADLESQINIELPDMSPHWHQPNGSSQLLKYYRVTMLGFAIFIGNHKATDSKKPNFNAGVPHIGQDILGVPIVPFP
jgi:hypothetical protein